MKGSDAGFWLYAVSAVLLLLLTRSQKEEGQHIAFHSHVRHSHTADLQQDCKFETTALFTDLFGSSAKSPWLLCAVESAMGMLGNSSVAVLTDDLQAFSTNWPQGLPNPAKPVSISTCLEGTPLRPWLDSPELASSHYRHQNIANALRLAALHKSGGTYLDLDIIPLNKVLFDPDLASISKQCEPSECGNGFFLNNAFLSFPAHDPFLHKLMEAFVSEYDGNTWGWNGPRLVSSLYKRSLCDTSAGLFDCHKLKVLPIERLAPFDWDEIMPVLGSQPDESYGLLVNNPQILAIHAYHNVWKQICIPPNSVFHQLMSDYCPVVSATHGASIFCQQQD